MPQQIKVILKLLKSTINTPFNISLDAKSCKIILDYITNLQEELFNEKQKFNDYLTKQLDKKIESTLQGDEKDERD